MAGDTAQEKRFAALMRAAQSGDRSAYAELLGALVPVARRVAKGRFRFMEAHDTDDLVQEILLSLHAARHTYDPARAFLPWFMAILRNRMADNARRYARRAGHEVTCEQPPETFPADDPNTRANAFGDVDALGRAMRQLPPGQRQAIELTKLREMTLEEASAATGTSVGALKVSVHRGMSALRRALGTRD
jgi:RNA polymerase sigma-70 factor (ECF subfamily)